MSTTIDQRVVEMQFDNRHFEENVQTSLDSIEDLRRSLNLKGATKGLENVDDAAKKVNMSGLGGAVETVRAKFSALEVMGVTALANITNSAVNAGKRIVSALTIDPIKTGFSEYETQINAVQTILANTESKGTTIDDVNKALDELNTYADKTIYNFTEMTRNIGTFTAAGVDLDTSTNAIQGIANLAAVSGSTSQQASTAMYQLSQALSSGTVKLMDWNSVVNAGMGGQVFQDALKETARAHGVAIDDIIEEQGSFRESLSEGWLSAEILTETLQKFTMTTEGLTEAQIEENRQMLKAKGYTDEQIESIFKLGNTATNAATKVKTFSQLWDTLKESAQSGWSQTWEIIVGDFEEAKDTLTQFSEVIGEILEASAKARNEVLQGWKDAGGRADLIESLFNVFEGIRSVVVPIKEAFTEIFPPVTVEQLVGFTRGLKELTEKLKLSDETSDKLKRTFKGLFAIVNIVWQLFSAVVQAVGSLFGSFKGLGDGILDVTASVGDWLINLRDSIAETNIFSKALQGVVKVFKFVFDGVIKLVSGFGNIFSFLSSAVSSAMGSMNSAVEGWGFLKIFKSIWEGIKNIASGIIDIVLKLAKGVGDALGIGDISTVLDIVTSLIAGGLGLKLIGFLGTFKDMAGGIFGIIDNFTGVFGSLQGVLEGFQDSLKADSLMKIAGAIAILAASILILSLIDSDKLYDSVVAIAMLFGTLVGSMALLNKVGESTKTVKKLSGIMLNIAISVLLLALALRAIAELETDQILAGVLAIGALITMMVLAAKALSSGGKKTIKGATQMVIFAAAIKILASACNDLASLSWEELAKGLVGVGVLLAAVGVFLSNTKFSGKAISTATGMVIIAAAIKILASACADFGQMKWEELGKGLAVITALLTEIAIFTKLTGNASGVLSTGIAVIAIAAAMKIFASAMQDMSTLSWEGIAKGLVAMAGALVAIVLALKFMPKNILGTSVGLIAVSAAILILSTALGKMGKMSWESIGKGLVTLGAAIVILAIGLNAMTGTLAGSAAMLIAVAALALLTPVLLVLGGMSWESIAKGLIVIAGAFAIVGVAGALLGPIIPAILGLAGALALIGVGVLAFGVGLVAIGAGLSAIAAGILALVSAVGGSLPLLVEFIAAVIIGICEGLANGIIAFCEIIIGGAPAIGEAIKVLVLELCEVLIECLPVIVDTILKIVVALLESLDRFLPQIVDALFKFLIGVIDSLGRNLPELVKAVFNFLGQLFTGVVDMVSKLDFESIVKTLSGVGIIAGVMLALAALAPLAGAAMLGVLAFGAVLTELGLVLAAIGALKQIPGLDWLINEGGDLLESIGKAVGKLVGGIIGGFAEGVSSSFPQIASDLSKFMTNLQPFVDGAKSIDESVVDGVKSIINVILAITGTSVLEGIASFLTGKSSIESFAEELPKLGRGLKAFSDSVDGIVPENITAAAKAAKELANMASIIPNEGGVASWFAGENSMSKFADELPVLGEGLKGFSDSVTGMSPENIAVAVDSAKSVAQMTKSTPENSGKLVTFGMDLSIFGGSLKTYFGLTGGITADAITASTNAISSISKVSTINVSGLEGAAVAIKSLTSALLGTVQITTWTTVGFVSAINNLGNISAETFVATFKTLEVKMKDIGKTTINAFIESVRASNVQIRIAGQNVMIMFAKGVDDKTSSVTSAFAKVIVRAVTAIKSSYLSFYNAGSYLVSGFASGISVNSFLAAAKARAMAKAAANAIEDELDINSPSKVGYGLGRFFGVGFVNAIGDYADKSYNASANMATSARNGLSDAISKVKDVLDSDMDMQPTIRPVLDLSDVRANAGAISGMLGSGASVGVMAKVGTISSMMNNRIQNGGNSEVVDSINALRKDLANVGGTTYSINGITYDDGSNITEAVKSIVRAARVERRI